jgi:hypothetical protein
MVLYAQFKGIDPNSTYKNCTGSGREYESVVVSGNAAFFDIWSRPGEHPSPNHAHHAPHTLALPLSRTLPSTCKRGG